MMVQIANSQVLTITTSAHKLIQHLSHLIMGRHDVFVTVFCPITKNLNRRHTSEKRRVTTRRYSLVDKKMESRRTWTIYDENIEPCA